MHPFKSYTMAWWQVSILKTAMVLFGIGVGGTWPQVFASWLGLIWGAFLVLALILLWMFKDQIR